MAGLPDALISQGRYWMSSAEAAELTGVAPAHVYPGLQRLRRRGVLPARGPIDPRWNLQVNSGVEPDL
jgi:DNA-binding IclR family transcriptional regulator